MKINQEILEDIYWDDEEAFKYLPRIKGLPLDKTTRLEQKFPRHPQKLEKEVHEQLDLLGEYDFTYEASRHEAWWLLDSLGPFYDQQWFDDVLKIIKGGKEASVYLCQANPSLNTKRLAAKVYRPRSLRNLRKDHIYREGRPQLDSDGLNIVKEREQKAIRKRTSFGKDLMHTSWIEHEFKTIHILFDAGCDVPVPYARGHNAILMSYIGDDQLAAPTLNSIKLQPDQAKRIFDQVLHNINLMLAKDRVHGDLSAYNILYWADSITIIDFPQAINPKQNPNAFSIFQRDVVRICEYFQKQGIKTHPKELAEDLWTSYGFSAELNILEDEQALDDL